MNLVQEFQWAFDEVRDAIARLPNSIDRWVLSWHQPQPMDEDTPWCFTCRRSWPCDEFVRFDERITARKAGTEQQPDAPR